MTRCHSSRHQHKLHAPETLVGNNGANVLDGKAGADTMPVLGSKDTYVVDNAGDNVVVLADGGKDTMHVLFSFVLAANAENLVLNNTAKINAIGNAAANVLTGNAGVNAAEGLGSNNMFVFMNLLD